MNRGVQRFEDPTFFAGVMEGAGRENAGDFGVTWQLEQLRPVVDTVLHLFSGDVKGRQDVVIRAFLVCGNDHSPTVIR